MVRLSAIDSSDTVTSTILRRGSFIGAVAILVLMSRVLDHVGAELKHAVVREAETTTEQAVGANSLQRAGAFQRGAGPPLDRDLVIARVRLVDHRGLRQDFLGDRLLVQRTDRDFCA